MPDATPIAFLAVQPSHGLLIGQGRKFDDACCALDHLAFRKFSQRFVPKGHRDKSPTLQRRERHHIGEPDFVEPERTMSCIGG